MSRNITNWLIPKKWNFIAPSLNFSVYSLCSELIHRAFLVAVFLWVPLVHGQSTEGQKNFPAGVWLISATPHDLFIETGVVTAEYPVLVVDASGEFRAYRFGIDCATDPLSSSSGSNPSSVRQTECRKQIETKSADLGEAPAVLILRGRIEYVQKRGARFLQSDSGNSLSSQISSAKTFDSKQAEAAYSFFSALIKHTFEIQASGSSSQITLEAEQLNTVLEQVNREDLVAAGMAMDTIGVPFGRYFRCALASFRAQSALPPKKQLEGDVQRAVIFKYGSNLARKSKALYSALDALQPFEKYWSRNDENILNTVASEFQKLPIVQASLVSKLGAYLNCPNRD